MRYIDADKFAERLRVSPAFPNMGMDGHFLRDVVLNMLDNTPTADVVEVVRCKDCEYRRSRECALWFGSLEDADYFVNHGDDFFCSEGKRIGGGDDA